MTISLNGSTQREQLKNLLKENVLSVVFLKKDGTERTMLCTLKPDLLPVQETTEDTKERKENLDILQVYDTENNGWRSFRLDSIITFTMSNYYGN